MPSYTEVALTMPRVILISDRLVTVTLVRTDPEGDGEPYWRAIEHSITGHPHGVAFRKKYYPDEGEHYGDSAPANAVRKRLLEIYEEARARLEASQ